MSVVATASPSLSQKRLLEKRGDRSKGALFLLSHLLLISWLLPLPFNTYFFNINYMLGTEGPEMRTHTACPQEALGGTGKKES